METEEKLTYLEKALVAVNGLLTFPFTSPNSRELLLRLKAELTEDRRYLLSMTSRDQDMAAG